MDLYVPILQYLGDKTHNKGLLGLLRSQPVYCRSKVDSWMMALLGKSGSSGSTPLRYVCTSYLARMRVIALVAFFIRYIEDAGLAN